MAKAGDAYQEIVGLVRESLDPDSKVKTGQWREGPDGDRDLDVEVVSIKNGTEHLHLIECKDWKRRVGISTVDALDSKRQDLAADSAAIYSNSGFTTPALKKAKRKGIRMFSALRAGDDRIRFVVHREIVAMAHSVERYSLRIFQTDPKVVLPKNWNPRDLLYKGLPMANYFRDESANILNEYQSSGHIEVGYTFKSPQVFLINGTPIEVVGFQLMMECSHKHVSQMVTEDVTLGHYDFEKDMVSIPNKEALIIGTIDNQAWKKVDTEKFEVRKRELEPGSFSIGMHLYKPVAGVEDEESPQLNTVLQDRQVRISDVDQ